MARCTRYNIMGQSLSVTFDRSVVFCGYFGFLHQLNLPPRYYWNIVESGVTETKPINNRKKENGFQSQKAHLCMFLSYSFLSHFLQITSFILTLMLIDGKRIIPLLWLSIWWNLRLKHNKLSIIFWVTIGVIIWVLWYRASYVLCAISIQKVCPWNFTCQGFNS